MNFDNDCSWAFRQDGLTHTVRMTRSKSSVARSVYFDDVLVEEKKLFLVWTKIRFKNAGHEYVISWSGWTAFAGSYELHVDGRKIEPSNEASVAVPASEGPQRFELVETQRLEEPLGEERRVIDNSHSSAEVRRSMTLSKEWSQTIAIENETTTSVKGEAGAIPL
jgi:hypothetical protein